MDEEHKEKDSEECKVEDKNKQNETTDQLKCESKVEVKEEEFN